jgi:hypothetical protein
VLGGVDRRVVAGDRVDLGGGRELLRLDLVAHRRDRRVLRTDEDDALGLDPARELGVLGQEPVARVDRLGAGLLAGRDDLVGDEVRLAARRRTDQDRLVGQLDVQRVAIGFGIHRDGRDVHPPRRLDDATGDLAAVGNQDLLEHKGSPLHENTRPRPPASMPKDRALPTNPVAMGPPARPYHRDLSEGTATC